MRILTLLCLAACLTSVGRADLIGTTVTAVLNIGGGGTNYYDPTTSPFVPDPGYQNSASNQNSATVTIVGGNEFGFFDGGNLDVLSFNASGFTFVDTTSVGGTASLKLTLTGTAFAAGVTELSNSFTGLTYGIVGDEITINIPSAVFTGTESASFSVGSVPEPSSLGLFLSLVGIVGLVASRRRRTLANMAL